jgi:hypothetical protein
VVYSDASKKRLGCVMMQYGKVIAYVLGNWSLTKSIILFMT